MCYEATIGELLYPVPILSLHRSLAFQSAQKTDWKKFWFDCLLQAFFFLINFKKYFKSTSRPLSLAD